MTTALIFVDGELYTLGQSALELSVFHIGDQRMADDDRAYEDEQDKEYLLEEARQQFEDELQTNPWTAADEDALEEWEHKRRERLAEQLEY